MRNFANIDYRLLAPAYTFLMILIFILIERTSDIIGLLCKREWLVRNVMTGLCAIWLVYPLSLAAGEISYCVRYGAGGFNTVKWHRSPIIAWLRNNSLDGAAYSNSPHAAYILSGAISRMCPNRTPLALYRFKRSLDPGRDNYLIWFKRISHNYSFSDPSRIGLVAEVKEFKRFSDGVIYTIKPRR
jgi:hypothetical protein